MKVCGSTVKLQLILAVLSAVEAVSYTHLDVYKRQEKEIADFITGPAYNAWWLMGNIEGWGGPMPQSQICLLYTSLLYEKEENRKIYRMNVLADDQGQGFAFERCV